MSAGERHGNAASPGGGPAAQTSKTCSDYIRQLWRFMIQSSMPQSGDKRAWLMQYLRVREMPPPVAKTSHIWGLGVGCVISGEFYGWNLGIREGGLGGLIVATVVSGILYFALTGCLCELTAALPFSGGSYAYARATLGKFGGYFAGVSESIEYTMFAALILVSASAFVTEITNTSPQYQFVWWIIILVAFLIFHCLNYVWLYRGFLVSSAFTCVVFLACVIPIATQLDFSRWAFEQPVDGSRFATPWFPNGLSGVLRAMPGAMFFWLGFDAAILAAEETLDKEHAIPRGLQYSFLTLCVCAVLLVACCVGVPPGTLKLGPSPYPLTDSLSSLWGSRWHNILVLVNIPSLMANFHALMFAYTRQTYALSRAGYLPKLLSITSPSRKLPVRALLMGAFYNVTAVVSTYITSSTDTTSTAEVLLALSVLSACLVYMTIAASFVILRIRCPNLPRPYVSPLGITGAVALFIFSGGTMMELIILEPNYRIVVALYFAKLFALGLYFGLFSKKGLVDSPEEVFIREHLNLRENTVKPLDPEEPALPAAASMDEISTSSSSTFSSNDVLDEMPTVIRPAAHTMSLPATERGLGKPSPFSFTQRVAVPQTMQSPNPGLTKSPSIWSRFASRELSESSLNDSQKLPPRPRVPAPQPPLDTTLSASGFLWSPPPLDKSITFLSDSTNSKNNSRTHLLPGQTPDEDDCGAAGVGR